MRVLDGDQFVVRIFLGESDTWHHTPLARALLERLRAEGFAGATVVHGLLRHALASGSDRLAGKRIVIWQFAARELAFGDFRVIRLP